MSAGGARRVPGSIGTSGDRRNEATRASATTLRAAGNRPSTSSATPPAAASTTTRATLWRSVRRAAPNVAPSPTKMPPGLPMRSVPPASPTACRAAASNAGGAASAAADPEHEIAGDAVRGPERMRLDELSHGGDMVDARHLEQCDRQVARDAQRPEIRLAAIVAGDRRRRCRAGPDSPPAMPPRGARTGAHRDRRCRCAAARPTGSGSPPRARDRRSADHGRRVPGRGCRRATRRCR